MDLCNDKSMCLAYFLPKTPTVQFLYDTQTLFWDTWRPLLVLVKAQIKISTVFAQAFQDPAHSLLTAKGSVKQVFSQMSNAGSEENSWADVDAIWVAVSDKQNIKSSESCFTVGSDRTLATRAQDPGDATERSDSDEKIQHTQLFSNVYTPLILGAYVTASLQQK